jgi:PAS domain S-box-containing protein
VNVASTPRLGLLEAVATIVASNGDGGDLRGVVDVVLKEVCDRTGWPVGHCRLVDARAARCASLWYLRDPARFARFRTLTESPPRSSADDVLGRVLAERRPLSIPDLSREGRGGRARVAVAAGLRSEIAVPVVAGGRVAAVLEFFGTHAGEPSDGVVELLAVVASSVGAVLERARTSARLRTSDERYRVLFESASDAIFVGGLDGELTGVNAAACRLTGYPRNELIGKTFCSLVAPEWRDYVRGQLEHKLGDERPVTVYETALLDRAGLPLPVEVTSTLLREGDEIVGVQAIARDNSERERAQVTLRESEERFRVAFDTAAVGMAFVALDGRWMKVNQALCELVGHDRGELLTRTTDEMTHPHDLDADVELAGKLLVGEIPTYLREKRFRHKDGHVVWVELAMSLVRDSSGRPAYFVSHIRDIRDRKGPGDAAPRVGQRQARRPALSPREREVLELLADGLTSAEAAARLSVTEETVQTHVRRSMSKLNARSRTQAVAAAIRRGLLDHSLDGRSPGRSVLSLPDRAERTPTRS